jgi:hypothetical protein
MIKLFYKLLFIIALSGCNEYPLDNLLLNLNTQNSPDSLYYDPVQEDKQTPPGQEDKQITPVPDVKQTPPGQEDKQITPIPDVKQTPPGQEDKQITPIPDVKQTPPRSRRQ